MKSFDLTNNLEAIEIVNKKSPHVKHKALTPVRDLAKLVMLSGYHSPVLPMAAAALFT